MLGWAWLGMADSLGCFGIFWDNLGRLGTFGDVWDVNQFIASLFSNKFQLVLRMMQSYQEAMALAGLDWPWLGWT